MFAAAPKGFSILGKALSTKEASPQHLSILIVYSSFLVKLCDDLS